METPETLIADEQLRQPRIDIEGSAGTGKSTFARKLVDRLVDDDRPVAAFREPGDTSVGKFIRQHCLVQQRAMTPQEEETLFTLYWAARIEQNSAIFNTIKSGGIVVCDRGWLSTAAMQLYAGGGRITSEAFEGMYQSFKALGGIDPDITVIILPPEGKEAEISQRNKDKDTLDLRGLEYYCRICEGYRKQSSRLRDRLGIRLMFSTDDSHDVMVERVLEAIEEFYQAQKVGLVTA